MVMVSLLTLPQQSGMNNNMMINNTMNFQNDNTAQQAEHAELLKNTLEKRLDLLNEIVNRCIATVETKDMEDLHNNFCYVINNLFLREFGNKKDFIKHIIDKFYDELLTVFLNSKADNLGNKLGQVVYSITDTILNKADKIELEVGESIINVMKKHSTDMVNFIQQQSSNKRMGLWQRTYSSTQELNIISPKTYKIFEILNLILNQKSVSANLMNEKDLEASGIEVNLYRFFKEHPLNNILHNVVTSFIISIGNSKFEGIKTRIAQNEGFFTLLDEVSKNRDSKVFFQQKCYLGHLKKLSNFFQTAVLKNETDDRWINFRDQFLKDENEKENKALGDVYVNNENDEDGIMFCFTMEEIKEKYSVFLGFKTEEEEIKKIEEKKKTEEKPKENDLLASESNEVVKEGDNTDGECK
jgi:hypothetical protein